MSTTLTGDTPTIKAPPPNGIATRPKQRKARAKRAVPSQAAPTAPTAQTTTARTKRAAPKKAAQRQTAVRSIPIGIASNGNATDLMTGFIQSMPKAGTALASQSRDACKATFAALIDWLYPATKAA